MWHHERTTAHERYNRALPSFSSVVIRFHLRLLAVLGRAFVAALPGRGYSLRDFPEWVCEACSHEVCRAARVAPSSAEVLAARTPRQVARAGLARRLSSIETGLSNPAYLHATAHTLKLPPSNQSGFPSWVCAAPCEHGMCVAAREGQRYASDNPKKLQHTLKGFYGQDRGIERDAVALPLSQYDTATGTLEQTGLIVRDVAPAQLHLSLTPARVRVQFTDTIADHLTAGRGATGVSRGAIRELSEAARGRLADTAYTLTETGKKPSDMITLTSPANWEAVYVHDENGEMLSGGRVFKRHMEAFKMRLTRKFQSLGIYSWSGLWFLEFQQRGAPHLHLMLFDVEMTPAIRKKIRAWLGPAWSSIVGNPDKKEKAKHKKAGTQLAKMKKQHFGYAAKYASKAEQKEVPADFKKVGRFWGLWNHKLDKPNVITVDYSHLNKEDRVWIMDKMMRMLATIADYSSEFAAEKIQQVSNVLKYGISKKFGFSIFGGDARKVIENALEIVVS